MAAARWVLLLVLLCGGYGAVSEQKAEAGNAKAAPATVRFEGFSVRMTYSPQAMKTLTVRKETVIAAAYLYGFPKPGTPRRYIDHEGKMDMDSFQVESMPGQDAIFKEIELKKADLERTDERGPQLLINVFSGRKSSPDNLLDCGIYEGPLKAVADQAIDISCKLIGESDATGH